MMDATTTAGVNDAAGVGGDGILDEQRMADGQLLCRRSWPLPGADRAVLIVHGLGEHSGRYTHVAAWFRARGYDVRSYDQRGHGRTKGPRGAVRHADDLLVDLAAVYTEYAAGRSRPPLLLGHSMGGLVVARTVLDGRVRPTAMLITSPALRTLEAPWLQKLARMLTSIAPNLPLSSGLPLKYVSHDAAVIEAYRTDPLRSSRITPRLADFIFRAGAASVADAPTLPVPTLLLVAGSDHLVDPAGSRDFAAAAASTNRLTTRFFDTLYHELMNEAEPARSQVMKQMGDWLERLPA